MSPRGVGGNRLRSPVSVMAMLTCKLHVLSGVQVPVVAVGGGVSQPNLCTRPGKPVTEALSLESHKAVVQSTAASTYPIHQYMYGVRKRIKKVTDTTTHTYFMYSHLRTHKYP